MNTRVVKVLCAGLTMLALILLRKPIQDGLVVAGFWTARHVLNGETYRNVERGQTNNWVVVDSAVRLLDYDLSRGNVPYFEILLECDYEWVADDLKARLPDTTGCQRGMSAYVIYAQTGDANYLKVMFDAFMSERSRSSAIAYSTIYEMMRADLQESGVFTGSTLEAYGVANSLFGEMHVSDEFINDMGRAWRIRKGEKSSSCIF